MPHTNLVLGGNWLRGEWPESVDVMHEGAVAGLKYVPERICKMQRTFSEPVLMEHVQEYECSECGGLTNAQVLNERDEPRYCMMCGARVAKEEL